MGTSTKMMGKVALLFVVAMAAGANATAACTITACTSTDGSTAAPAGGCYCGTGNVFVAANKYCSTTWTPAGQALDTAACGATMLTGAVVVSGGTCTCGSNGQQIANTKWAFLKNDKSCFAQSDNQIQACANTDGSAANTADNGCYCGTGAVLVADNAFCYKKSDNVGFAMTKKICGNTVGTTTNGVTSNDICTCSTSAATPLSTTSAGFCFVKTTGVGAVTAAASSACTGTGADGSTATTSTTNCYCGTSQTLTTTGQFCYSASTALAAGQITAQCFLASTTSGAATTGMSTIMLLAVALLALR